MQAESSDGANASELQPQQPLTPRMLTAGLQRSLPFPLPFLPLLSPPSPHIHKLPLPTGAPKGPKIVMTPSRARVGDTVRILVHGFQVGLSLSIWEGGGRWEWHRVAPASLAACSETLHLSPQPRPWVSVYQNWVLGGMTRRACVFAHTSRTWSRRSS